MLTQPLAWPVHLTWAMANSQLSNRTEHSVLCALQDLKSIEAERVADEDRLVTKAAQQKAEAERVAAEVVERTRIAEENRHIEALRAEAALVAARADAARAETARAEAAQAETAGAEQLRHADTAARATEHARLADDQRALRRLLGNPEPATPTRGWLWPVTVAVVALALGSAGIAWSLRPPIMVTEQRPTPPPPVSTVTAPLLAVTPTAQAPTQVIAVRPKKIRRDKPAVATKTTPSAATSILRGMELCGDDPTCSIH